MRFQDKVALITAAASGIGRATADIMAQEGAIIVAVDNNEERLERTIGELRKAVRKTDANDRPRLDDLQRVVFGALEPFLVDSDDIRPGQIKRSSLGPLHRSTRPRSSRRRRRRGA